MKRIMALDLGDVRIGVAMSDLMQIIANGYETYRRANSNKDFEYFADLIKTKLVETVVIGLPINMDGTIGDRAEKAKAFGEKLKEFTDARIVYQDERLTTVSAQRVLIEAEVRREKRKDFVDKIAATIILQTYLQTKK